MKVGEAVVEGSWSIGRKGRISTKEEKEKNIRRTERERIIERENQHTVFI